MPAGDKLERMGPFTQISTEFPACWDGFLSKDGSQNSARRTMSNPARVLRRTLNGSRLPYTIHVRRISPRSKQSMGCSQFLCPILAKLTGGNPSVSKLESLKHQTEHVQIARQANRSKNQNHINPCMLTIQTCRWPSGFRDCVAIIKDGDHGLRIRGHAQGVSQAQKNLGNACVCWFWTPLNPHKWLSWSVAPYRFWHRTPYRCCKKGSPRSCLTSARPNGITVDGWAGWEGGAVERWVELC